MFIEVGKGLDPKTAKEIARGKLRPADANARPIRYNPNTGLVSFYKYQPRKKTVIVFKTDRDGTAYDKALAFAAQCLASGLTPRSAQLPSGRWRVSHE